MGRDESGFEQSFRTLCETCGVGFWHIDTAGHTVYMNPTMAAILELDSPADIGEQTYHRFFADESLARMRVEHQKRPDGLPSTYEVELIGQRNGRRNVMISGAPLRDELGRLAGLIGTFTDITDRKRSELRLRESETRLRSLFGASVDAIGVSHAGHHVMVNPAYVSMFGYASQEEVLQLPIYMLIAPSERTKIANFVRRRSAGDGAHNHYVTRGLRKSGEEFPMEVHASSYEEAGNVQTVVILRDISERIRLERQLRQAQKMEALGRLAGGVAHDFNNLLMVIMGTAELLFDESSDVASIESNARLIRSTGERGVALTRQLLTLTRSQVVRRVSLDLNSALGETTAMLRRLIGANIEFTVDSEPGLHHVRADAGQLQQVLMNLCVNARDAMPDGGQIRICMRNVSADEISTITNTSDAPARFVMLAVHDTGHGMTAAVQERLFEPFFTTKAEGEGTGLGLSTVYGIVKQSGGQIRVLSAPGKGSTFSVYLPASDAPASEISSPLPEPQRTVSASVLLVDDELTVRELLQRYLERVGYRVVTAACGADALKALRDSMAAHKVDVVISDVLMPTMSGVELAHEIDRICPGLPILFISGYADDHGAAFAMSRPRSGFLSKPFGLQELTSRLASLLEVEA